MATQIEYDKKTDYVGTHYGVTIFKVYQKKYVCTVWSELDNTNVDLEHPCIIVLKGRLDTILINNFYQSLEEIKGHFKYKPDYNNPEQNLENLRLKIVENIIDLIENI